MRLIFLREAHQDQREASVRYRREGSELVRRFLAERRAVLKRIKATPQQFPFVEGNRQQALMSVFPYKIIFERTPEFLLVVALAHTSRDSDYWSSRTE